MSYPMADKWQLCVTAQWITMLFAWDDLFDEPEENNLMEDTDGVKKINNLLFSVFDHTETSETQAEALVVIAFREYVNLLAHQFRLF